MGLQLIASVTSSQLILHYFDSKLYGVSAHVIVFTFFRPLDLSQALSHSEMSSRQVSSSLSGSPPLSPPPPTGPAHRTVHWSGVQHGLPGVPPSQWDQSQGPQPERIQ